MTSALIPARMTEARESRSMSMDELAKAIGVTRQSVSKYERGIMGPTPEMLQALSIVLGFPIEFFYKPEQNGCTSTSPLFFRSNSGIAKKVKSACRYQVKWTNEIKKHLERYVDFVAWDLPILDKDHEALHPADIEGLALSLRKKWGLSEGPIGDLIGILENHGIIVSRFATNEHCTFNGIDAFSCWDDGTPYVLYHSIQKSAVRTRFSLLHELGHLIMHSAISESDAIKKDVVDLADRQADRFAAAFLLPATSFPKDVLSSSLASLEIIKRKWGAAMSTIIRRCEDLELLTENQINYLKRQMSVNRYWHREPLDDVLTVAEPEMLRDAIYLLIDNGILTRASFIDSSALSADDLKHLCGLPDAFFDGFQERRKPVLRVL